ncbi:MAG TPA: LPXTG cell wall anchor domain-containing protein [Acidimicrobiales bacterium]|nr:LPXTG cell wall anchor domain-containing protein [Acidimicrobiales bacterium]
MSLFSKLAAAGLLVIALVIPLGGVASAQSNDDCERDDYCNPDTPDEGDRDEECVYDEDTVDSDGPGGTDDEVECDEAPVECIYDEDVVDSDGPGGTDDEVNCDEAEVLPDSSENTPGGPAGVEVPAGGPAQAEVSPAGAAAQQAPSGSLPLTGGDVVGMAIIGALAVGLGALLVRRSKKAGAAA